MGDPRLWIQHARLLNALSNVKDFGVTGSAGHFIVAKKKHRLVFNLCCELTNIFGENKTNFYVDQTGINITFPRLSVWLQLIIFSCTYLPKMAGADRIITLDEVAQHNKDGDAWIGVNGYVYNVSKFAKIHPGGEGVLLRYFSS